MHRTLSICVLVIFCIYYCAACDNLIVNVQHYGKVKGKYDDKQQARVFQGIPYAGSVSHEYRWTDPRDPEPWGGDDDEPLDATKNPPVCPQNCDYNKSSLSHIICPNPETYDQVEDCLILNVYTPRDADEKSKLPVLAFIHGGSYLAGYSAAPLYDGSYLANHSNIIVVTMNYRLGALGFLAFHNSITGDDIRGNFGIKDQRFALQWVQKNIAYFGGDPTQVTLSGESAGAMSVAIHMTSPKSAVFHQAIIQSDPFGLDYKTLKGQRTHGYNFALLNFGLGHGCLKLQCLRDKSFSQILAAQRWGLPDLLDANMWREFLYWTPNVDDDELTGQPLTLFEEGKFKKVPTMMGTTTDEGIMFVYRAIRVKLWYSEYFPVLEKLFGFKHGLEALKLYPGHAGTDNRLQLSEAFEDYVFTCPTIRSAKSAASSVALYSYVFNYHVSWPDSSPKDPCTTHNCHGSELPFVFHTYENLYDDEKRKIADAVSEYWGNFVSTGDPNTCGDGGCPELPLEWPLFNSIPGGPGSTLSMEPDFQFITGYRLKYCEVVDKFNYGSDVLSRLYQIAERVVAYPYLKDEL